MEKKHYIAPKYENGKYYDMYYDEEYKWEVSVDKDDPDYEEYQKPGYDILVAEILKDNFIKVKKSRKFDQKKIRKIIACGIAALLVSGSLVWVINNPKIQYIGRSFIDGRLHANENNLKYAEYVINHNETISLDVKEYLLSFFDEIMASYKLVNIDAMLRITDKIAEYDFSNVDLSDEKQTVFMLADIINSSYDISTRCLSQEFYEYYFNTGPSEKSLLFDALNGKADSSLAVRIINGGDEEYYAYLAEMYGFSDSQIEDISYSMIKMQVREIEKNDFDYYINQILAFNSSKFDFFKSMKKYFDEQDLKNGIVTYNGNIFAENIVITVQKGSKKYDVYYDKILGFDASRLVYFDKFKDLMKNFDGNINRENSFDRLVVYLHMLLLLRNDGCFDENLNEYDYFYSLYSVGEEYFGENFYSYLSNGDIDYRSLTDVINNEILASYYLFKPLFLKPLTEEQLTLIAETLLCLQQEVRDGKLEAYDYENCFGSITEIINLILGDEVSFNFYEMISQGVNNGNVNDSIKRFYDSKNAISLELTSN